MKYKRTLFVLIAVIFIIAVILFLNYRADNKQIKIGQVGLDTLFLKVSLKTGGFTQSIVNIKNYNQNDFSIKAKGEVKDFLSFEVDYNTPNEEKTVNIMVNGENKNPGVYLGEIEVMTSGELQTIPVIIEVQSKEVDFYGQIELFPKDGNLAPNQKFSASIKIYDLNKVGRNYVNVNYFVRDFSGNVLVNESENVLVNDYAEYTKQLDLNREMNLGEYILGIVVKRSDSVGASTYFFQLGEGEKVNKNLYENNLLWIIIIFGGLFLIMAGFFVYSIVSRDRLFRELERQHREEMTKILEVVKQKRSVIKKPAEIKKLNQEVKKKVSKVNKIYKTRIVILKKLKKEHKESEMERKMKEWKKQGYNLSELNAKNVKKENPDKKAKKFSKQGYKF